MIVQTFKIENKAEADAYLSDLLKTPKYRSITEVECRAHDLVSDEALKAYFIAKGAAMLRNS